MAPEGLKQQPDTLHVLTVEDNELDALRIRQALDDNRLPLHVIAVPRAEQAQDLIKRGHRFDLVLLDLNLPGMNGNEFLRWLRAERDHGTTPVVILTSSTLPEDTRESWAAGASLILSKSEDQQHFTQSITKALSLCSQPKHQPGSHD